MDRSGGFAIADNSAEGGLQVEADGDTPGDLYEIDLANGHKTRLVKSLADDVNPADLVRGEVVRFKSTTTASWCRAFSTARISRATSAASTPP